MQEKYVCLGCYVWKEESVSADYLTDMVMPNSDSGDKFSYLFLTTMKDYDIRNIHIIFETYF